MVDQCCDRCGEYLPEGSIKYTVHIQILSDFDGFILCEGEDCAEETQKQSGGVDSFDEQELDDDVFQELTFVLCGNCKGRFAGDPFGRGAGFFKTNRNARHLFH